MGEDIIETAKRAWKHVARGGRIKGTREAGPIPGHPSVQEDDIEFIRASGILTKCADVEYYGPGAEEKNKRREETIRNMGGYMPEAPEEKGTIKKLRAEKKELKRTAKALRKQLKKLRGE
jgi:hypothetical protein